MLLESMEPGNSHPRLCGCIPESEILNTPGLEGEGLMLCPLKRTDWLLALLALSSKNIRTWIHLARPENQ
jgi:hypothetical protein